MVVNRRQFLENTALTVAAARFVPHAFANTSLLTTADSKRAYGSGYFGGWIEDELGLPAFHYTCDQINDKKAVTEVNAGVLTSTEHIHQVGNDRILAIASNYGHIRVRQDEGAPKFLNDYAPERGCFAGGFGYLTDGKSVLSTFYPGNADSFDRVFGVGYFRKKVSGQGYGVDQIIFAPFGDDPVLMSQITITNLGTSARDLRFSFRAFMQGFSGKGMHQLRRDFGTRFAHHYRSTADGLGLVETKEFLGRDPSDDRQFQGMIAYLEKNPNPFLMAPEKMSLKRLRSMT